MAHTPLTHRVSFGDNELKLTLREVTPPIKTCACHLHPRVESTKHCLPVSHCVFVRPLLGRLVMLRTVQLVLPRNLRHEWVV